MPITEYIDYKPAKVYDQGKSPTCVAHAFFTLLSEHVQQKYKKEVEFDFYKYHDEMEKHRNGKLRVKYLCVKAKEDGYRTKCGRLVKIGSYRRFSAWRRWDFLCRHIQSPNVGPMLFAVKRYKGHKLNPKDTDVIEMPTEAQFKKKKMVGHMMMIRGFQYSAEWLIIQNSWGKGDSVRLLPHEVLNKICKYMYYVKNVTIK